MEYLAVIVAIRKRLHSIEVHLLNIVWNNVDIVHFIKHASGAVLASLQVADL